MYSMSNSLTIVNMWLTLGKKASGAFELQVAVKPEDVLLESEVNCTNNTPRVDVNVYPEEYDPDSSAMRLTPWQYAFAH
jgi:hypothetical protein